MGLVPWKGGISDENVEGTPNLSKWTFKASTTLAGIITVEHPAKFYFFQTKSQNQTKSTSKPN